MNYHELVARIETLDKMRSLLLKDIGDWCTRTGFSRTEVQEKTLLQIETELMYHRLDVRARSE